MRCVARIRHTQLHHQLHHSLLQRTPSSSGICIASSSALSSSLLSSSAASSSSLHSCLASCSAHFHTSAAVTAAPAAKPAAAPAGKPAAGGAPGAPAGPSKLATAPEPNSKRWVAEGWNAPRLVPQLRPEVRVNAEGFVAEDAAELADAAMLPVLHAEVREDIGSKFSSKLRSERLRIPGIICDRANPRRNQLLITMDRFELEAFARKYRRTAAHKVCLIQIEGQEPIKVIADEIARHAVTEEIQVANWFLFKPHKEKVRIKMPIVYTGTDECIGVKRGGVIVILRDHVPCVWTGGEHIPPFLHIDMANTDGGKVFRNHDLKLPEGLRLLNERFDYVVATVLGVKQRSGDREEEVVAAVATATTQQPSAIQIEKEKKEKERREEEEMVAQKLAQAKAKGKK